jgi:hypothetical protein
MLYINPQGEYPRHYGDIMLDAPGWKLGDDLPEGWVQVAETERPAPGADQVVVEAAPKEVKGVMTQQWLVRDMTAEELERRDAPSNAKARLVELGFTEAEIEALVRGLVR